MSKPKLIRITTIPGSLNGLLKGQLKYMNNYFDVIAISSAGEKLKKVSENEGVRVVSLNMTRTITPINDVIAVVKLYFILKKEKPLIVHSHTPKAGIIAMLASKLANVPIRLHTVAGLPLMVATGNKRKILNFVEKLTYSLATKVYPNSEGLYKVILENKFTSINKLKVIANGSSNGIDTTYFNAEEVSTESKKALKDDLKILTNDFVYIFVGRIVKDKGINELVEAFKELNSLYNNTKLILVGDFEKELDPILSENEIEINRNNSIIAVGYQNDVRSYFAIADVLTFPSYREGFPNVVMQACSMSVNSIVTDINGCNEIIRNNENGLIIPVANKKQLFEKMEYLYKNQDENKRMAMNSRKRMQLEYERTFVWQKVLEEYKILITNK